MSQMEKMMGSAIILFMLSPALQLMLAACAMLMARKAPKTQEGKEQATIIAVCMVIFNIITWFMSASWFMAPGERHVEVPGLLGPCIAMLVTVTAITSIKDTHPVTSGPFAGSFAAFLVVGVLLALSLNGNDSQQETELGRGNNDSPREKELGRWEIEGRLRELCKVPRTIVHRRVDDVTDVLFMDKARIHPLNHPYRYIDIGVYSDRGDLLSWQRYGAAGLIFESKRDKEALDTTTSYQRFIDDFIKETPAEIHPVPRYGVKLGTAKIIAKGEGLLLEELTLKIVDLETRETLAERANYQTRLRNSHDGNVHGGCQPPPSPGCASRRRYDGSVYSDCGQPWDDFILKILEPAPSYSPEGGENSGQ